MVEHENWMRRALYLAQCAYQKDEVPIGAVVVLDGRIIGEGYNLTMSNCDPSAHAEIIALRSAAAAINNHRLPGARMYVTIEPCAMCAGAVIQSRLDTVIFGATDSKAGAAGSVLNVLQNNTLNHQCEVVGDILSDECAQLVQEFFKAKRKSTF